MSVDEIKELLKNGLAAERARSCGLMPLNFTVLMDMPLHSSGYKQRTDEYESLENRARFALEAIAHKNACR